MMNRRAVTAALAMTLGVCDALQTAPLPAFPGAEGFGALATGGRGGQVLFVTTLNEDGPGSLQAALDAPGPRTILFRVSGVIAGVPHLSQPDVTIAGQSSPGGVTLRGLMIEGEGVCEEDGCPLPAVLPRNFIVQHLRLRPAGANDDGLRLHRARLGIIDHVSVGNAEDEAVQISFSSDVTIQRSLFAETLGEHAEFGGMLLNYSDPTRGYPLTRLSIHHNVFNRVVGRLPEISRETPSATGSTAEIEFSNNLAFDPGRPIWIGNTSAVNAPAGGVLSAPIFTRLNAVGNLFVAQPSRFSHGMFTLEGGLSPDQGYLPPDTGTRLFLQGNQVNLYPGVTDPDLVYCCNDFPEALRAGELPLRSRQPVFLAPARLPFPAITYDRADALSGLLGRTAGAFPRDPMDSRLMAAVLTGHFDPAPRDVNPRGDALRLPFAVAPLPPVDTDHDGLPDGWEHTHGLDPLDAGDGRGLGLSPGVLGRAGWTNLEVYLAERAHEVESQ